MSPKGWAIYTGGKVLGTIDNTGSSDKNEESAVADPVLLASGALLMQPRDIRASNTTSISSQPTCRPRQVADCLARTGLITGRPGSNRSIPPKHDGSNVFERCSLSVYINHIIRRYFEVPK